MLCAGFAESHLMLWSLTPQSLPCRCQVSDASSNSRTLSAAAAGDTSDNADDLQQRSVLGYSLVFCWNFAFLAWILLRRMQLLLCLHFSGMPNFLYKLCRVSTAGHFRE